MNREFRSEYCSEHGVWVLKRVVREAQNIDAAPARPVLETRESLRLVRTDATTGVA